VEGALPRTGRLGHGAPGEPPPRHFASRRLHRPQLIGLHAESQEGTSRWLGIDIDNHDLDAVGADARARCNLAGALSWWRAFGERGYDPLLFDSSGRGGYQLWELFAEPAPTAAVSPRQLVDRTYARGGEQLGDPIDGAVEFTRALAEQADIVIHTARFAGRPAGASDGAAQAEQRRIEERIRAWLDQHGLAHKQIALAVG
jgi:hypothetical protein